MIEELARLVDPHILARSGKVFYSGRSAFARPSKLYLLGLNPGGRPDRQAAETVGRSLRQVQSELPDDWSAYRDESWNGRPPGTYRAQPRVRHLLSRLALDPRATPASNAVFVRSSRAGGLGAELPALLRACWPVHQAIIDGLGVRVVACFGREAGRHVRAMLDAHAEEDRFVERNKRGWTSTTHANANGQRVVTLSHPGVADWRAEATDPTDLVNRALARG